MLPSHPDTMFHISSINQPTFFFFWNNEERKIFLDILSDWKNNNCEVSYILSEGDQDFNRN